jgi:hypothetical protein
VSEREWFQWPDGVQNVEHDGDKIRMQVCMLTDEDGFLGRNRPSCAQVFRLIPKPTGAFRMARGRGACSSGTTTSRATSLPISSSSVGIGPISDWG